MSYEYCRLILYTTRVSCFPPPTRGQEQGPGPGGDRDGDGDTDGDRDRDRDIDTDRDTNIDKEMNPMQQFIQMGLILLGNLF